MLGRSKKSKAEATDIDSDFDLDFGDDFDFGDGVSEDNDEGKGRSPIVSATRNLGKATAQGMLSKTGIERMLKASLPESYGELIDNAQSAQYEIMSGFSEGAKELAPIKRELQNILRKGGVLAERNNLGRLSKVLSRLGGTPEESSSGPSAEQQREDEINRTLGELFSKQEAVERKREEVRQKEEEVKSAVEAVRFDSQFRTLASIDSAARQAMLFHNKNTFNYYRKSIELGLRQLHTLRDIYVNQESTNKSMLMALNDIKLNTGLPDYSKKLSGEALKEFTRQKFMARGHNALFGSGSFLNQLGSAAGRYAKKKIGGLQDVTDQLFPFVDGLVESKLNSGDEFGAMGVTDMVGGMVGDSLASKLGRVLQKPVRQTKWGRKLHEKAGAVRSFNQDMGLHTRNFLNNDAEKFLRKHLSWKTKKKNEEGDVIGENEYDFSRVFNPFLGIAREIVNDSVEKRKQVNVSGIDDYAQFGGPEGQLRLKNRVQTVVIPKYLSMILREVTSIRTGSLVPLLEYNFTRNDFVEANSQRSDLMNRIVGSEVAKDSRRTAENALRELGLIERDEKGKLTSESRLTEQDINVLSMIFTRAAAGGVVPSEKWLTDPANYALLGDEKAKMVAKQFSYKVEEDAEEQRSTVSGIGRDISSLRSRLSVDTDALSGILNAGQGDVIGDLLKQNRDGSFELDNDKVISYLSNLSGKGSSLLGGSGDEDDFIGRIKGVQRGYSKGGYTGDSKEANDKEEVAGIVHRNEVVFNQEDVKRWGGYKIVEELRKGSLATFGSIKDRLTGVKNKGKDKVNQVKNTISSNPKFNEAQNVLLNSEAFKRFSQGKIDLEEFFNQTKSSFDTMTIEEWSDVVRHHYAKVDAAAAAAKNKVVSGATAVKNKAVDTYNKHKEDPIEGVKSELKTLNASLRVRLDLANQLSLRSFMEDQSNNDMGMARRYFQRGRNFFRVLAGSRNLTDKEVQEQLEQIENITADNAKLFIQDLTNPEAYRERWRRAKEQAQKAKGFLSSMYEENKGLTLGQVKDKYTGKAKEKFNLLKAAIGKAKKVVFDKAMDVYHSSDVRRPAMTARKIAAGYYRDIDGKVITALNEVKGDVYDRYGELVISYDEFKEAVVKSKDGFYKRIKDARWFNNKHLQMAKWGAIGLATIAAGPIVPAIYAIAKMRKSFDKHVGQKWRNRPRDVYIRGESQPALLGRRMRLGHYFCVVEKDGKPEAVQIKGISDITGPVIDSMTNEYVITEEDFNRGLVDKNGRALDATLTGRMLKGVWNYHKWMFRTAGKVAGVMGRGFAKGTQLAFGLLGKMASVPFKMLGIGLKMGGGFRFAFDRIRRHLDKDNIPYANLMIADEGNKMLATINQNLQEGLVKQKEKKPGDTDGDGDRDNSIADVKQKEEKAKEEKRQEEKQEAHEDRLAEKIGNAITGDDKNKKEGFLGKLMGMVGGLVGGLFGKLSDGLEGLLEKGGFEMPEIGGGDEGGDGKRRKGKWGKIASFGGKALGLAGAGYSAYSAYDNYSEGNYGSALLDTGLAAGTLAATPGALSMLGAAGTFLLSNPIGWAILGIGAAAATGYGIYRLAKRVQDNSINEPVIARMLQYGYRETDEDEVETIREFEGMIEEMLIWKETGVTIDREKLKDSASDLLELFDVNKDDAHHVERWVYWFDHRFQKPFLAAVKTLKKINPEYSLGNVPKLKDMELKRYYQGIRPVVPQTEVTHSPFKDEVSLPASIREAQHYIDERLDELKDVKDESDKSSNTNSTSVPLASGIRQNSPVGQVTNNVTASNNLNQLAKPAAAIGSTTLIESTTGGTYYDGKYQLGTSILYKVFGLKSITETVKVSAVNNMMETLKQWITWKGDKAIYDGDVRQLAEDNSGVFGVNSRSPSEMRTLIDYLKYRFIPVYLNLLSSMKKHTGRTDIAGLDDLKPSAKVMVLSEVSQSKAVMDKKQVSVWTYANSPWGGSLNTSPDSISTELEELEAQLKAQDTSATKAKAMEKVEEVKADKAGVGGGSKGFFSSIKEKMSSMWDSFKEKMSESPVGTIASAAGGLATQVGSAVMDAGKSVGESIYNFVTGGGSGDYKSVPPAKGKGWRNVKDTIVAAGKVVGIDPGLLGGMAAQESSLDPNEKAKTSSASGLFQFLRETWAEYMGKYAAKYGIPRGASPFDSSANAILGAQFVKDNYERLKKHGTPNAGDLYLAHFLGPGRAIKFIKANQNAPAAPMDRAAAGANKNIFYTNGRMRTVGEVRAHLTSLMVNKHREMGVDIPIGGIAVTGGSSSKNETKTAQNVPGDTQPDLPKQTTKSAKKPVGLNVAGQAAKATAAKTTTGAAIGNTPDMVKVATFNTHGGNTKAEKEAASTGTKYNTGYAKGVGNVKVSARALAAAQFAKKYITWRYKKGASKRVPGGDAGIGGGYCARGVRQILQLGGKYKYVGAASAKNCGPQLMKVGFTKVATGTVGGGAPRDVRPGDVFVFSNYGVTGGGGKTHGHIQMYVGNNQWVSDFNQGSSFRPGSKYTSVCPWVQYRDTGGEMVDGGIPDNATDESIGSEGGGGNNTGEGSAPEEQKGPLFSGKYSKTSDGLTQAQLASLGLTEMVGAPKIATFNTHGGNTKAEKEAEKIAKKSKGKSPVGTPILSDEMLKSMGVKTDEKGTPLLPNGQPLKHESGVIHLGTPLDKLPTTEEELKARKDQVMKDAYSGLVLNGHKATGAGALRPDIFLKTSIGASQWTSDQRSVTVLKDNGVSRSANVPGLFDRGVIGTNPNQQGERTLQSAIRSLFGIDDGRREISIKEIIKNTEEARKQLQKKELERSKEKFDDAMAKNRDQKQQTINSKEMLMVMKQTQANAQTAEEELNKITNELLAETKKQTLVLTEIKDILSSIRSNKGAKPTPEQKVSYRKQTATGSKRANPVSLAKGVR